MIGSNLGTCWRGPPLTKSKGYEQLEDAVGVGQGERGMLNTHTHTQTQCHS